MSADLLAPPHRSIAPLVNATELVCGLVAVRDLTATRTFYEEVLGLECVSMGEGRMLARTDAAKLAAASKRLRWILDVRRSDVIQNPQRMLNHWGLDLASKEAVDDMHAWITSIKDRYGIAKVHAPSFQHAAYSFYFEDQDSNWWEYQFMPPQILEFSFGRGDLQL